MQAIFIDAENRKISKVEYDGELESLYSKIDCRIVAHVDIGDACCFFDHEGLDTKESPFFIDGFEEVVIMDSPVKISGNALIIGNNGIGGSTDCPYSVEEMHMFIYFPITQWILTLLKEKNIDIDTKLENEKNISAVIEAISHSSRQDQEKIKNILVDLDFKNKDVKDFLNYLALGMKTSRIAS